MRTVLVVVILAAGCASTPVRSNDGGIATRARLDAADARVLQGCYRCLQDARLTFESLAAGPLRATVVTRLFEVNVLLGLREGELALDPIQSFDRAETLIPELPAGVDAGLHLAIARTVPLDPVGMPIATTRRRDTDVRALLQRVAELRARLDASQVSPAFRGYLASNLACMESAATGRRGDSSIPAGAPALLQYKLALCPTFRPDALGDVMDAVPEFVEAGLYRARAPTLAFTGEYLRNQRAWLTAAHEAFPRSSSVSYALGAALQTAADCRRAIQHYDEALALQPGHENAALQRVVCLSALLEHTEAIAGATRIIEADYPNIDEAYYWRAWNHHHEKRLVDARRDIDLSLARALTAKSYILSGIINYDQGEYTRAEDHLSAGLKMDRTQCVARWYLGLVAFARENWVRVGDAFGDAAACYESEVNANRVRLSQMQASDFDEETKAAQIAALETAIRADQLQCHASAVNAANGYTRSNRRELASEMLRTVPDDSPHAAAARELRAFLETATAP